MKIKLIEVNDYGVEVEVSLFGWKYPSDKYMGWALIIYFPRDSTPVYFRGKWSK
jgi:hypothetical protein